MLFMTHLRLLFWKNFKLHQRRILATLVSVFLPLFFLGIVALARNKLGEGTGKNVEFQGSPTRLRPKPYLLPQGGLLYTPVTIATTTVMEAVLAELNYLYADQSVYNLVYYENSVLHGVDSEHEMEQLAAGGKGVVGIVFETANLDSYKLRFPYNPHCTEWEVNFDYPSQSLVEPGEKCTNESHHWNTEKVFADAARGILEQESYGMDNNPYYNSGEAMLQAAIELKIVEYKTGSNTSGMFTMLFHQNPRDNASENFFAKFILAFSLPVLLFVGYIYPILVLTRDIVVEKESGLKDMIKRMGVSEWTRTVSWYLEGSLRVLISFTIGLGLILAMNVFAVTNLFILLIFFFLYALTLVQFAMFVASISTTSKVASPLSMILFVVTFVPFLIMSTQMDETYTNSKVILSCLSMNMCMGSGLVAIARFEAISRPLGWAEINKYATPQSGFTLLAPLLGMLLNLAVFAFLTYYFENVLENKHGVTKPWHFIISSPLRKLRALLLIRTSDSNTPDWRVHEISSDYIDNNHYLQPTSPRSPGKKASQQVTIDEHEFRLAHLKRDNEIGIAFQNLSKTFGNGKKALDSLTVHFFEGNITCLLGHNGSGKSTTMSLLSGVLSPTKGTAIIKGKDIRTELNSIRKDLGYCPQTNVVIDAMTIKEQLWFFGKLKGLAEQDLEEEIDKLLKDLRLNDKAAAFPPQLSGGMLRKLCIGLAFMGNASVVLLDEPTSGLDAKARRGIWDLINQYRPGKTIVLTTHFMDEANMLGDRIAILGNGKLYACGSPSYLKRKVGAGYQITFIKTNNTKIDVLDRKIKTYLPDATLLANVGKELSYKTSIDSQAKFPALFKDLDQYGKDILMIESYGVTSTTMEEVFVSFAKQAEKDAKQREMIMASRKECPTWYCRFNFYHCPLHRPDAPVVFCDNDDDEDDFMPSRIIAAEIPTPQAKSSPAILSHSNIEEHNKEKDMGTFDSLMNMHVGFLDVENDETDLEAQPNPVSQEKTHKEQDTLKTGFNLRWQQFKALIWKRYLSTKRNYKVAIFQISLPVIFIVGSLVASHVAFKDTVYNVKKKSVPMSANLDFFNSEKYGIDYKAYLGYEPDVRDNSMVFRNGFVRYRHPRFEGPIAIPQSEFEEKLIDIIHNDTTYLANYKAAYSAHVRNSSAAQTEATIVNYINAFSHHSLPIAINTFSNLLFNILSNAPEDAVYMDPNGSLRMTFAPFKEGNEKTASKKAKDGLEIGFSTSILILLGLSHLVATFTFFLVSERESQSKQIQFLSGIKPRMYWVSTFCWDMLNYLLVVLIIFGIFMVSHVEPYSEMDCPYAVAYLLVGFGWAYTPMVYIMQRLFKTPVFAYTAGIALTFFTGIIPIVSVYMMRLLSNFATDELKANGYVRNANLLTKISYVFPGFSFGIAFLDMSNNWSMVKKCIQIVNMLQKENDAGVGGSPFALTQDMCFNGDFNNFYKMYAGSYFTNDNYFMQVAMLSMKLPGVGGSILALFFMGFLYFELVVLSEYWNLNPLAWDLFSKTKYDPDGHYEVTGGKSSLSNSMSDQASITARGQEDVDVIKERERVLSGNADSDHLVLKNLTKVYSKGKSSTKPLLAVKELTLGIGSGECFGLLGANGAGKSTTFKMLTGEIKPSFGDAVLGGKSLVDDLDMIRHKIGYCPQFDALINLMTGRETLEFFARIRGHSESDLPHVTQFAIAKLDLVRYADCRAGTYSGGNKRKLSTAIALLGSPMVIYLDEPTAGVDANTRRFLWDVITQLVQHGQLVVLTSHSLEECEAICTKLVMMSQGTCKCLGSVQHLKQRFGSEICMTFKLRHGWDPKSVKDRVCAAYPAAYLRSEYQSLLTFGLPGSLAATNGWGDLFSTALMIAQQEEIEDYSVSQCTLEDIFLQLL